MSAGSWAWARAMRVTWSVPAALRAVRATVVIPCLFALTFKVIGDAQMTLFAVFGSFGALVITSFGGTRRDKALAHLGLAVAGSVTLTLGTVLSSPAWLAAVGTIPVAFAVYAAGSVGPNAASAVNACLLAYVLPIASVGSAATLPSRLAGWWLAQAVSTAAVLLLAPRPASDRLLAQAAATAVALADELDAALHGATTGAGPEQLAAARRDLMNAFVGTPYRPTGRAVPDQGLANLVHLLDWCAGLVSEVSDGHLDLLDAAQPDRELLALSVQALRQIAARLSGERASVDLERILQARLRSTAHLQQLSGSQDTALRAADNAFHAQALGVATAAAAAEAMVATGAESPGFLAVVRQRWLAGLPTGASSRESSRQRNPDRPASAIATDASLRSVWFVNSMRGAIAIAAAVAVAKVTGVQHAFWVVLGTLSVLRSSATATGATAMRALAGTVVGFVIGGALLVAIGTNPTALWVIYPFAVLVAAYTPGTAPFAFGQAAFTILVVILFNLLAPAGWKVGLLRVEDVAIGCAVSLVVGFLFWPRGVSAVLGDDLADAFLAGSDYLGDAADWALGDRDDRPGLAVTAIATGVRVDDAVRAYLTEQGSKRLAKKDLWALVMGSMQLRLTAHSMASLPTRTEPHADDNGLHTALRRQVAGLAQFYDRLAAQVARPSRAAPDPLSPLPPSGIGAAHVPCGRPAAYRPDALWVGLHLDHLEAHTADVTGPAERLAQLRRRPWWR